MGKGEDSNQYRNNSHENRPHNSSQNAIRSPHRKAKHTASNGYSDHHQNSNGPEHFHKHKRD